MREVPVESPVSLVEKRSPKPHRSATMKVRRKILKRMTTSKVTSASTLVVVDVGGGDVAVGAGGDGYVSADGGDEAYL